MVRSLRIYCETNDEDSGIPVPLGMANGAHGVTLIEYKLHLREGTDKFLRSVPEEKLDAVSWFNDVVDEILVEILKKCDGKSIAKLQCANRRMLQMGSLARVWRESLLNHYGLFVPHEIGTSFTTLRDIYRELLDDDRIDVRLPFRGFLTDGGMHDGDNSFWVDNMFHHNVRKHYRSSSMAATGIRCVGLFAPNYKPPLKLTPKRVKPLPALVSTQKVPSILGSQDELQVDSKLGTTAASSETCLLIRKIQVCKTGGLFFRPVDRGAVLLGNKSSACAGNAIQCLDDFANGLYSQTMSPLATMVNGFVNLATILVAYQNGKIPKPVRVGVEVGETGAGEWVEFGNHSEGSGAMHPVVWFRFYSNKEKMNGWTRERNIQVLTMKSKFLAIGTSFLMVKRTANESKYSSGLLNMPLKYPYMGDAVCTLLSSSDTILPEVIETPTDENYVEVNYVWFHGKEVQVVDNTAATQESVEHHPRPKT